MVKLHHYTEGTGSAPFTANLSGEAEDMMQRMLPNELVRGVCRSISPFVSDDFLEDVLLDSVDINEEKVDTRFKATYPPADMCTSSFTILKQPTLDVNCRTLRSKNSPESFLKIVSNAYSGVQRGDGLTKLQCNLISQQSDTDNMIVNGFEFDNEMDYWTFVGEIKRSIACIHTNTQQGDEKRTGFCHYQPSPNSGTDRDRGSESAHSNSKTTSSQPHTKAQQRPSGGSGFLGSLFSAQKESVPRTHRWEVRGSSLQIIDTHTQNKVGVAVGAVTDTTVGAFDLHDLIALTLSVDYHSPSPALLVASLAHCERDRDRAKECDKTGICTSHAYQELQIDLSLQRLHEKSTDIALQSAASSMPSAPPAQCSAVHRRGIGEISILPLSEDDVLFLEQSHSEPRPSIGVTSPGATQAAPSAPMSLSPMSFGRKSFSSTNVISSAAPSHTVALSNVVEVLIRDRTDPSSVVGMHSLPLSELAVDPQTSAARSSMRTARGSLSSARNSITGDLAIETASAESAQHNDANKAAAGSKSPLNSMFSFYRSKPHTTSSTDAADITGAGKMPEHHGGKASTNPDPVAKARDTMLGRDSFINNNHGAYGGVSSPPGGGRRIDYQDPVFCDVELALKANLKAARLVIRNASDLPSSSAALEAKGIPPSVYATVYLVDHNGEKRSVNSADSRTETIKSHNPEWNKEVLLQNEKQGVDDITAVMVLFRDASVGMLKHHHIGRVNIPFSCFLDNTQADFCLPLEPTYRMDVEERVNLGMVHFSTELIEMGRDNKRAVSIVRAAPGVHTPAPSPAPAPSKIPNSPAPAPPDAPAAATASNRTSPPTAGDNTHSKVDTSAGASSASNAGARRMTVIGATAGKTSRNVAAVRYCLYRASAGGIWWPVRLLRTAMISNNSMMGMASQAIAGGAQSLMSMITPLAGAYGLRNDCTGFIWCGFRSLVIELVPGVTGVLFNCEECVDGVLEIEWFNVVDCLDVSDTAVLLTLRINVCTSNATQLTKQEYLYAPAGITLLIGPCQAAALRREVQQRAQFTFIRENLVELVEAVNVITAGVNSGATGAVAAQNIAATRLRSFSMAKSLTPPPSPSTSGGSVLAATSTSVGTTAGAGSGGTAGGNLTLTQIIAANNAAANASNGTASAAPTVLEIIPMARSVSMALEGMIQHAESLLNRSLLMSLEGRAPSATSARGVLSTTLLELNPPVFNALTSDIGNTKKTILQPQSPIVKDRQFLVRMIARAKVYCANLRFVCGKLMSQSVHLDQTLATALPSFNADTIHCHVKNDCDNVQLFTPLRSGAKVETMIHRFEHFLEAASERIRDYMIFSGCNWETTRFIAGDLRRSRSPLPGTMSAAAAAALHGENDVVLTGRESLELLIDSYYNMIVSYVRPLAGSREAFRKLVGQDIKNCVLKLLIENNMRFEYTTELIIGASLNLRATPPMPMVPDVNAVMEWYSECLLHDTRSWLIRTSQNASAERKNRSNLPWDVELVGDHIISFLPETLRFQLNVYTELCASNLTSSEYDDAEEKAAAALESGLAIGLGMDMPTGMQMHPTVPVAASLSQRAITARVNEMILHAVSEALVLLAEEYVRALQGRHWDKVDPTTGKFAVHLDFLCAVANDCHRVLSRHVTELQETIQTTSAVCAAKRAGLVNTFGVPAEMAMRNLMKIIFTDVQSTLIDFDNLWQNPKNLLARTLTTAVSSHLRNLRSVLVPDLFFRLVGNCMLVIAMRFLLFLRARSASKTPMSTDEITRFIRDVEIVKQNVNGFVADSPDSAGRNNNDDDDDDEEDAPQQQSGETGNDLPDTLSQLSSAGQVVNSFDDITSGTAVGQYVAKSALQNLQAICQLLRADYDTALFHRTAMQFVERYSEFPAATSSEGKHHGLSMHALASEALSIPQALLLHCIAPLRADAGPDLNSFLNAILLSHQHSHSAVTPRAASLLNCPAAQSQDVIVRIFGAAFTSSSTNNANSSHESDSNSKGFKGLLSPGAIKHWREKAIDAAVKKGPSILGAVKARHNEEYAADLLRLLGLEGFTNILNSTTEDNTNNNSKNNSSSTVAPVRRNSGRDFSSALSALMGSPTGTNGTAGGSGGDAGVATSYGQRNLHNDFNDHGEDHPATAEKKKKKGSIFSHIPLGHMHGHKEKDKEKDHREKDQDSSSGSDAGTEAGHTCMIQIDSIQVRALHSSSYIGGPNPYVYFSVNGRKRVKTSVKWDHKEATWSETKDLPVDMQSIQDGRITIKVFDKERMRRKRLMGTVSVKLAPLEYHSFESWYALEGGEQGNYGEVYCRLRLVTDTSIL